MVLPPDPGVNLGQVREDYDRCVRDGSSVNQAPYHYGGPPRDFGLWRRSEAARTLAQSRVVLAALQDLYGSPAEPFQTLNFSKGSSQPLHADEIHFQTEPADLMIAAWTAMEDVAPEAGPLVVYPGSHVRDPLYFWDIGLEPAKYGVKDPNYAEYEKVVAGLALDYERVPVLLKAGETVLFHAGVIHGGSKIEDHERTRYSQVTHYWIPGKSKYAYAPMLGTKDSPALKDMATKAFYDKANWEAH